MYAISYISEQPEIDSIRDSRIKEKQLIEKLCLGDQEAFRELVESHKHQVFNTCLGFLKNNQDAEDVSQEVFIQVFNSIADFKGNASLSTWIYRIAVTKSMELIRYRKRKKRWNFFKALSREENDGTSGVSSEEYFNHPGLALEQKERAGILYNHIEKLPDKQRIAFTLQKVEGLSYKEVAEVMEISLSAVESFIYRGKESLKKSLRQYYQQNELD